MTKDTPIYKILLVSLVCTIFASYPNMALMSCDWISLKIINKHMIYS